MSTPAPRGVAAFYGPQGHYETLTQLAASITLVESLFANIAYITADQLAIGPAAALGQSVAAGVREQLQSTVNALQTLVDAPARRAAQLRAVS